MSDARPPESAKAPLGGQRGTHSDKRGSPMTAAPTLLLVPGLRDEAPGHWQAILARQWPDAVSLPALGRSNIDLAARMAQIEKAVQAIKGPVVVVAHSGGVIATVHWAQRTQAAIHGALLATPPLFAARWDPSFRPLPNSSATAGRRYPARHCRFPASWRRAATTLWARMRAFANWRGPGALACSTWETVAT